MTPPALIEQPLVSDDDVVLARQTVRRMVETAGFSAVAQTMMVTAASELARNTIEHGGGGTMKAEAVSENGRSGVRLVFEDHGPGIDDIARAMQDGYSTNKGLGLGLGGTKRLVHEFVITSSPGEGTRVTITRYL